jgi:hypothetical protein
MSDDKPDKPSDTSNPQQEVGLMLQRRALYRIERESEKPPRSPKRIALVSVAVLITMTLFLVLIDKGVKVAHRIIDIWTPVIFDTKKTEAISASSSSASSINPSTPYMIRVEPRGSDNQSTSAQSTK